MQKDRAIGLGFAAIGVLMIVFSKQIVVLENLSEPGPRLFPIVTAIGLIVCGLGVFFESLRKKDEKDAQKAQDPAHEALVRKRYAINIAILVGYLLALYVFGFLIATPFGMLGFIYALANGKKVSPWKAIVLAIATTLIVYGIFTLAFQLQLPPGLLFY